MTNKLISISSPSFWGRHWLKGLVILVGLYFFWKKDFSFQVKVGASEQQQEHKTKNETTEQQSILGALNIFENKKRDAAILLEGINDAQIEAYLKRFVKVAISEQQKYGVPASITLANALLLSQAGSNNIATNANNHFAIISNKDWLGKSYEDGNVQYRSYSSAWESFRAHSNIVGKLTISVHKNNYKAWTKSIPTLGVWNLDHHEESLNAIIEKYQLYKLDK